MDLFFDLRKGQWTTSSAKFFGLVFLCLFLWVRILLRHKLAARSVARACKRGDYDTVLVPQRLRITPDAVTNTNDASASTTLWEAVEKIIATENHAFIFLTRSAALILPKHAFSDEWEFEDFVKTAKAYRRQAAD